MSVLFIALRSALWHNTVTVTVRSRRPEMTLMTDARSPLFRLVALAIGALIVAAASAPLLTLAGSVMA